MDQYPTQTSYAEKINRILFAIADAVNSTEDLNELYRTIRITLGTTIDVTNFFIAIVDRERRTLYFPYHIDTVDDDFSPLDDFDTASSLTGLVVTEKKSILLGADELQARNDKDGIWGPSPLIWMGSPLIVRDEVIGVVAVQNYTDADVYNEIDLQLLTAVSHQIALAIDRKRFLDKLQESEERLNFLVKNSSDSLIIIDADGNKQYVNPAIEKITGFTILELEEKPLNTTIHPDDLNSVLDAWREAAEHPGKTVTVQYRHIHKTNGWVYSEAVAQSFLGEPAINGIIASVRDITERKEREKELLKNEKLHSLGILAGGIAHDFNNILAGIIGNISLAQVSLDPGHRSCELLVKAEKATERAEELAHQLLTFSRGGEPVKALVSVQHLVDETVSLVLLGSSVKASLHIPETIYALEADEGQISQVFHNIVINAVQSMHNGGVLTITAQNENVQHEKTSNKPYIRLTFSDEGCGISEENLKRIFDPYFTTKSDGNGLGLASVYSIINKHGGEIEVISEVNKGTTFELLLPALGKVYEKDHTEILQKKDRENCGGRILVMDDEKMLCEIASAMLIHLGYEVVICGKGEDAVKLYKESVEVKKPFIAAIMDLTIPGGIGGKEAAEQIITLFPKACLIVSSGYSNDPIMSNYKKYGFSGTLAKPYNIEEVEEVLNSVFSG